MTKLAQLRAIQSQGSRARRVPFGPKSALGASLILCVTALARPSAAAGTWTKAPASASNNGPAFGLWLLTDGTVLSHGNALNHWVKLTPDANGSYANGKWTTLASSAYARGGAQEHVLKDGRFFEAGGEFIYVYPGCASNCTQPASGSPLFKNAEIYDPVANTWTVQASAPLDIGDTGSATLADGRILDSTRTGSGIQIFDPASGKWTTAAASPLANGDENSWASLQNGGVLAVAPKDAAIYDPVADKWTKTGPLPAGLAVTLTAASGYPGTYDFGDTAGISLMFDGRVIAYGLGITAIYTPGATAHDPGTWALGPKMPYKVAPTDGTVGNSAEDEYTVTEPNGKVMIATHAFGGAIDVLQEYDPDTNTIAMISPPPDAAGPYPVSYLNLPNGQVMTTGGSSDWLYTPDSPPKDEWRPTVTNVVFNSGSTYTLTGTQLSGLINGGDEGDDMTMAENYPIVWLQDDAKHVYYCKSFAFSSMMPSKGNTPQTCQFTTPAGLPNGSYDLYVSAVGVQSKEPVKFTVGVGGTGTPPTGGGGSAGAAGAGATGGSTSNGGSGGSTSAGGVSAGGTSAGGASSSGAATNGGSTSSAGSTSASGASTGSGGTSSTAGGSSRAGSGGSSMTGGTDAGKDSGGCGCRLANSSQQSALGAGLSLLGLALLNARRRRRRE